jgi:hypothetical protein
VFGPRPGGFGGVTFPGGVGGRRPGAPIAPPIVGTAQPPGVPVRPPSIVGTAQPPVIHPPAGPSPGYPHPPAPPNYPPPPPSYPPPPPSYPPPPSRDRRTYAPDVPPFDPMGGYGYDPSGEVPWGYYPDDGAFYDSFQGDMNPLESGGPAWDLWQGMLASYLDTRNAAVSDSGDTFPETTAGDVRKASLALSRELCLPRYDFADLTATRAAWRDALTRVHALCASVPWRAPYPENERFWLTDALALAQRLAAVDARRNAMVARADGVLTLVAESDPLTTWQDLRAYFLGRRLGHLDDRTWRYPETTVGDVRQVVRLLNQHVTEIVDRLPAESHERGWLLGHVRRWRPAADAVKAHARQHHADDTYPENAAFWRASRKIAIALSTAHELLHTPGYLERFAERAGRRSS